jgi:hypothetical protein
MKIDVALKNNFGLVAPTALWYSNGWLEPLRFLYA